MALEPEPGPGPSSPPSCQLLDAVLQNLYDFGEAEDEAEQKRVRRKRENREREPRESLAGFPS